MNDNLLFYPEVRGYRSLIKKTSVASMYTQCLALWLFGVFIIRNAGCDLSYDMKKN